MNSFEDEIKNFKVLVVEDESLALNHLGKFLKRIFINVTLCSNGLDAFLEFKDNFDLNRRFDLIISDVNMPKLDGLEMAEKIREYDNEVPIIFLTARSETNNLIKAINLGIDNYILKPIDLNIIEEKIRKTSKELYYKKSYEYQQKQIENYLDIIENGALIVKYNLKGEISYINKDYCSLIGYKEKELIGKDFKVFKHPIVPDDVIEAIWKQMRKGEVWEGKSKNITKSGEDCFFNTKIIPIFELDGDSIKEFMSINFLVTDEELQKREKNKNYLKQISLYKTKLSKVNDKLLDLEKQLHLYLKNEENNKKLILSYEDRINKLNRQISSYEKNSLELNKMDQMKEKSKNKQFEIIKKSLMSVESKNKQLSKDLEETKSIVENKNNMIIHYRQIESDNQKRIDNLIEIVNNLEEDNEQLKNKKSIFNIKK